jgi:hypothetical protein
MDRTNKTGTVLISKTFASKQLLLTMMPKNIILNLKGKTEESIINELLDLLSAPKKIIKPGYGLKKPIES